MRTLELERRDAPKLASVKVLIVSLSALALGAGCSGSTSRNGPPGVSGTTSMTVGGSGGSGAGGGGSGGAAQTLGGGGNAAETAGSGGASSDCRPGSFACDGTVARGCDGQGTPIDCATSDEICVDGLGCVVCDPAEKSCDGDSARSCRDDGSGYRVEVCDAVQGTACDPKTGRCKGVCSASALGAAYIGCDYFPTVTANQVEDIYHFAVAVSNTTDAVATVTVTRGNASVIDFPVPSHSVEVRTLPWVPELKSTVSATASVQVTGGAYRLRSNQPVTVYQFSPLEYTMGLGTTSATNDASLLLPVSSWTGKYWVVARHNWGTGPGDNYHGFYTVTAAQDGTKVAVKPGPIGAGVLPGISGLDDTGSGMVTLNAGDVFSVYTAGVGTTTDAQDVTGTLVQANKPVQVIGGHQCTNVPDDIGYCDHLEESMFPAQTLATSYFVTAPLIPNGTNVPKVEMVRVVATEDQTSLQYDPPLAGAPTMIALAGGWIDIASTAADFRVTASKPVSVAQYMEGQNTGGGAGDPAMALAVTESQYRTDYLIHAPTNYPTNFANIIAPSSATVSVDGAVIDAAQFQAIGSSSYSVIRMPLSNDGTGDHTISGSKPVGVTVYGYGVVTSYWYPGGLNLNDLTRPSGIDH